MKSEYEDHIMVSCINTKQNNFHINSVLTKLFSRFNKLLSSTDFYLVDASSEGAICSVWKKGRGPDPMVPYPRWAPCIAIIAAKIQ